LTGPVRANPAHVPDPAADPVVLLGGTPGSGIDEVARALAGCGITVARSRLAPWQSGPLTIVLVDPRPVDWLPAASRGVPVVVVYSAEPTHATLVDALLRGAHAMLHRDQVPADLQTVLALVRRG